MYVAIRTDTSDTEIYRLDENGKIEQQKLWPAGRTLARDLPGEIDQLIDSNYNDITGIIVFKGPGSFTGLRIGIGVAQGLAAPFHIPLIGIPCLDAVAYGIPSHACVLAATDARMGEVFYVWFDTLHHVRLSDYQVGKAAEVVLPKDRALEQAQGVGNAFALAEPLPCVGTPQMPTAVDYLKLALTGRYAATSAAQAELLYVRNKIALTASEQAARKAASC